MRFFAGARWHPKGFHHARVCLLSKTRNTMPKKKTASQAIRLACLSSMALASLIMSSPSWAEKNQT